DGLGGGWFYCNSGGRQCGINCTTKEFNSLANQAGIKNHTQSATTQAPRQTLRAELDALAWVD
ncbi:MAG: hypothetical protein OXE47_03285, partial [Gammaproteobacteria bacterium]|nr:hypothetical protein [Gammaproteobacteria bacterium]